MYFLTIFASDAHRSIAPDASRMNFVVRLIMPWRLPAGPAFTRPEAVKLKRFLAADLVFIFGISISVVSGAARHAWRAGNTGKKLRGIGGAGRGCKQDLPQMFGSLQQATENLGKDFG